MIRLNNLTDSTARDIDEDLHDTNYFSLNDLGNKNSVSANFISIVHLNIRSLRKNMENFKIFLNSISHDFDIICLTETWCKEENIPQFLLPNYKAIHQVRYNQDKSGGGICIFVKNSMNCIKNEKFSRNDANCESLCIEIESKCLKNKIIVNTIYRPPNGNKKIFRKYFNATQRKLALLHFRTPPIVIDDSS